MNSSCGSNTEPIEIAYIQELEARLPKLDVKGLLFEFKEADKQIARLSARLDALPEDASRTISTRLTMLTAAWKSLAANIEKELDGR